MIVFLNGASCSGKTSLARALQSRWPTPLLHWSLDHLISQFPLHLTGTSETSDAGFPLRETEISGVPTTQVNIGWAGHKANAIGAEYVKRLAEAGFDVVVDYLLLDADMFRPFAEQLANQTLVLVGVFCDEAVLQERNDRRPDRAPMLAVSQQRVIHACRADYDLELDTSARLPKELARELLAFTQGLDPR